jgi:hypothetical protein
MNTYFIHDGRNELGPFSIDNLKKQKLTRNTPIRLEGKDNWGPAEKIGELKELVAPRKIKRPKDIVPVMIERATDFKQQHPKTAYGFLLGVALVAGISIYSLGKEESKDLIKNSPIAGIHSITKANLPAAGITKEKEIIIEAPKEDKEKAARLHWNKLITSTNSNYGIGFLGGIKELKVIITNRSAYPIDEAIAKVTYIKANGDVWKTKLISIYGVQAHDSKQQSVPDVGRGKKVTVSLHKVVSKKMKLSYVAGKKISNPEDPYLLQ